MRGLDLPLIAVLALASSAAPAAACDAEMLQRLDPPFGDVISRVQLPSVSHSTVEVEKLRLEAMCDETLADDPCIARLTEEHAARAGEGERLAIHLEGPSSAARAVFEASGKRHEVVLPTYEDVASYMEAERVHSPDIRLVSAEQVIDPAQRTAVIRVVVDQPRTTELGAGVRMVVQLSMSPIDAMQAGSDLDGIDVISWTNQVDGTAIIDLRCTR